MIPPQQVQAYVPLPRASSPPPSVQRLLGHALFPPPVALYVQARQRQPYAARQVRIPPGAPNSANHSPVLPDATGQQAVRHGPLPLAGRTLCLRPPPPDQNCLGPRERGLFDLALPSLERLHDHRQNASCQSQPELVRARQTGPRFHVRDPLYRCASLSPLSPAHDLLPDDQPPERTGLRAHHRDPPRRIALRDWRAVGTCLRALPARIPADHAMIRFAQAVAAALDRANWGRDVLHRERCFSLVALWQRAPAPAAPFLLALSTPAQSPLLVFSSAPRSPPVSPFCFSPLLL
mmetsp:Transcript_33594/g.54433  ORF Transcript_33594/g.54433 Transcript_33594/m.54433 type:complete len:292 (-) Transcript_33594:2540-3415(-)